MADSNRRDEGDDAVRREDVGARAGTGATDATGAVSVGPERGPGDEPPRVATGGRRRSPAVSAVVAALGLWVVVSALVFDAGAAATWNAVGVGATVALGAGYDYYRVANDVPASVGVGALVALLGLWLVASAALLDSGGAFARSAAVSGLLIAGLAGYGAYEAREARPVTGEDVRAR